MFFLLTNFIYPIKQPIFLSRYFQFTLDNPRSKEELAMLKNLIQKSWDLSEIVESYQYQRFPLKKEIPNQDIVTFEILVSEFLQKYYGKKIAKNQIKKIEGNKDKIIEFYAKHWVIVRYETKEMINEEKKLNIKADTMRKKGERGFFLLDDDHIFERRQECLVDYSYLISLLPVDDDYSGWNFLITKSHYEITEFSPSIRIMHHILLQALGVKSRAKNDSSSYQYDFEKFIQSVSPKIKLLDEKLRKKEIDEKVILYIGDVLESVESSNNNFSSLVRIVSIIEMLLTHQPNYLRFNVEDSITKQFILKTAVLVQRVNTKVDLQHLKLQLKEIYAQRSNIVHGNFSAVDTFIKKLKKKEQYFDSLISDCYSFARIVLDTYIQQSRFVHFLKEN